MKLLSPSTLIKTRCSPAHILKTTPSSFLREKIPPVTFNTGSGIPLPATIAHQSQNIARCTSHTLLFQTFLTQLSLSHPWPCTTVAQVQDSWGRESRSCCKTYWQEGVCVSPLLLSSIYQNHVFEWRKRHVAPRENRKKDELCGRDWQRGKTNEEEK